MKITNISPGPRGIHTLAGSFVIPVGGTIEADLSDAEHRGAKETGWFNIEASKGKPAANDGPRAVHHGGGKFNVMKGDELLLSGLNKADADAFNAMNDEDRASYIEASKGT